VIKRRDNPDFTIEDAGKLRIQLKTKAKADPTGTNA
jgi:hypothetical protein